MQRIKLGIARTVEATEAGASIVEGVSATLGESSLYAVVRHTEDNEVNVYFCLPDDDLDDVPEVIEPGDCAVFGPFHPTQGVVLRTKTGEGTAELQVRLYLRGHGRFVAEEE